MKKSPEKHMPYFAVLEALATARGCPLCSLERTTLQRHIDSLLYEKVNDPLVRRQWAASRGYCHRHANMLAERDGAFGMAILYHGLVEAFREALDSSVFRRVPSRRAKAWNVWETHADCPACRVQAESRARRIEVLLAGLDNPEMREALEKSAGFCVPHFLAVIRQSRSREQMASIIEAHRGKYAELACDLAEFQRKHNYRHAHEKMGKEADSWNRAIRMIVGDRDLF